MAVSSKDIETLLKHYTEVECKRGVSLAQYFESNGVPYHVFDIVDMEREGYRRQKDELIRGMQALLDANNGKRPF